MPVGGTYTWTTAEVLGTLSLIEGLSLTELLQVIGAKRTPALPSMVLSDADWQPTKLGDQFVHQVQVDAYQGWLMLLEPVVGFGVHPALRRPLSQNGRLIALSSSLMKGTSTFIYAKQGVAVRDFDPLLWPMEQFGDPLVEEEGLRFGPPDGYQQAVLLAERLAQVSLDDAWLLGERHPTYYAPLRAPA